MFVWKKLELGDVALSGAGKVQNGSQEN